MLNIYTIISFLLGRSLPHTLLVHLDKKGRACPFWTVCSHVPVLPKSQVTFPYSLSFVPMGRAHHRYGHNWKSLVASIKFWKSQIWIFDFFFNPILTTTTTKWSYLAMFYSCNNIFLFLLIFKMVFHDTCCVDIWIPLFLSFLLSPLHFLFALFPPAKLLK